MTTSPIIPALQSFRRRVRLLTLVTGIGTVAAMVVGAVLALVLVDYLLNLQSVTRLLVLLAAAGAFGGIIVRYVVRPLAAKLSLTDVAGRLEESFPQFEDRLRSTVNFVTDQADTAGTFGSSAMQQHVVDETTSMLQKVDLSAAIQPRPAVRAGGLALAALALAVSLGVLTPNFLRTGLMRLVAPFSSAAWPKWVQIEMIDAPPTRVPVGQQVPVKLRLTRGDRTSREVVIHYQYFSGSGGALAKDGGEHEEFMTRNPDGTYSAALDAKLAQAVATGTLTSWIEAGDDRIDLPATTIVQRLAISRVEATVTPPAYAKLSATTYNLSDAPAVVAAGSTVQLTVLFNKSIASPDVAIEPLAAGAKAPMAKWVVSAKTAVVGTFVPEDSLRFHLRGTDIDGFQNAGLEEYEIIVRPDQSPTVQIEEPRRNEERTAVAVVPLQAVAEDDFAVKSLSLWVERLSDHRKWELPLVKDEAATGGATFSPGDSSPDRRRYRLAYEWDLAKLANAELKSGDVLEYCLGVTDNYELNGKTHPPAYSSKLRITIISQEELSARINEELRNAAAAVAESKNSQTRLAVETAGLADDTKDKPSLDKADQTAIERVGNQQTSTASAVRQIATRLEAVMKRLDENKSTNTDLRNTAKETSELLDQTSEGPMKDSARDLSNARSRDTDSKDPEKSKEQRNNDFNDARKQQQAATDNLQKALDRLGNTGSLSNAIQQFAGLLADQQKLSQQTKDAARENLGKSNLSEEDQKKLDKIAGDQKKLGDLTEKALADLKKAAEVTAKTDPTASQSLKQAAEAGQQQQVTSSQQQAAGSIKKNQQSASQSSQKQAEIGLEMIISALRDAERRKLEELAKKLAEMQQQLAMLLKRQAGHNIDNLRTQGADTLAKVGDDTLKDLAEKSDRTLSDIKEGKDAPPQVVQMSASQQQTERNTRDLAKTAEETPDGAPVTAALTRAAGRMERAIVHLKANELPQAYSTPQVEALAALAEAKAIVDEQQKKAQEKIEQQQKEAVKARYQKIKIEQERINAETKTIDAGRDAKGNLNRVAAVSLNKLPGDQGKLSDDTKAIEADLEAAGGVVYIWANKDIVEAMNNVKDALGARKTDEEVRIEQARVVEQLDAMIKNLSIKPPEKKFEQKQNGGGGGGQGAARLPSEAELRLLKDLQKAVNASTTRLNKLGEKDGKKHEALGGRQGELRDVLSKVVEKSSGGRMKIGEEPDNRDLLPEEATSENVEDQELETELLSDKPDTAELQKGVNRVGDRMARSRQRLAINHDSGKVTQLIQERILKDLDELIEQSRSQQSQSSSSSSSSSQSMVDSKPQDGKQSPQKTGGQQRPGGSTAANESTRSDGGEPNVQTKQTDIRQSAQEWGAITPRQRQAVLEGSSEKPIDKYRNMVEDYWKALAEKRPE